MGCICSKGISTHEYVENHIREKETRSSKRFITSSRKDEVVMETDGGHDATMRLISDGMAEENAEVTPNAWECEKIITTINDKPSRPQLQRHSAMDAGGLGGEARISRIANVPNGVAAAHATAGWPYWLTAVAGEAINGCVPRRAESFEKLEKIGQGTYSSVYRARDLETGKIVAMKKVHFVNMDPESVRFMARKFIFLRKLDHQNVMKLECLVTSRVSGSLYLVFEYMEHDLTGLAARPGIKFTEPQIKCYMQQLLRGIEHCHSRGVLHRDIKGSNLLIDNNGNLKIGDFGLATFFRHNQKEPLTSRVVTLWYRPPELLLGSTNYGVSVDLWSAGCILAELFHGKAIMPGRTEVEQLHKIFKLCGSPSEEYWKKSRLPHATVFKPQHPYRRVVLETFKDFPPSALTLLNALLAVEPEQRGTASMALQSEFFTTEPFPCDPSTLPKYPPSKEFDAKRRDEEARRHKAYAGKDLGQESAKRDFQLSRAVPAPCANAELQVSIQRYGQSNPKSNSEKFNNEEEVASGFRLEPLEGMVQNGVSHSGHSIIPRSFASPWKAKANGKEDEVLKDRDRTSISLDYDPELRAQRSFASRGSPKLSRFDSSVGGTNYSQFNNNGEASTSLHWPEVRCDERPKSSNKKDERDFGKAFITGHAPINWVHSSGPLLPAGGNIEEMLKEHEKRIQRAVRKARFDKTKKSHINIGQTDSLLHDARNAR
ncbi:hypothetical protein Nepgr_023836 [Nepenthes gracilis]|uniref:Protein kinase domain-containing protein n=1 Tax=Nepenthes gracilis TaxID=150966 RepID=A0AAD3T1P0_NEPGR|nr:hypothetical protein Nepgr_023836 [Nepenthes gracilis]